MVFETADPHIERQINTHFKTIADYLEKQVCLLLLLFCKKRDYISIYSGWNIGTNSIDDTL